MASGNNFRYFRLLDGEVVEADWESIPELERQPRRLFHNVVGNAEISTTFLVADPDLSRQDNPQLFEVIVSWPGVRHVNCSRDSLSSAKEAHDSWADSATFYSVGNAKN
jgi:hypothetical protein